MNINYNVAAHKINSILQLNDKQLNKSMEKLSSGMKITPSEAPASYALAKKLNAHIEGTKIAKDNNNDGISIINIADGVLDEITDIIQRLKELAINASDEALTIDNKEVINNEAKSLMQEIQKMADTAQFNGQKLLDGTFARKGYITVDGKTNSNFKLLNASDDIEKGNYKYSDGKIYKDGAVYMEGTCTLDDNNILTIKDNHGKEFRIQTDGSNHDFEIEFPKIGGMNVQIGAMEGESLEIIIPQISLKHLSLENLDLVNDPLKGLDKIEKSLNYTLSVRSKLGAYQNRLEHNSTFLDTKEIELTNAYSRIMDTDIAAEMTNYTTQQILVQAAMSMLAQANDRPSQILQLLQ